MNLATLEVDDVRLAVRSWGDPAAPPVVLVHGWGQSGRTWQRLAARLPGFHVIAPDLRGHGESDAPATGYADPAVWAAELAAVLEFAGRPAVLVGWSYGGLVITDYVRERGTAGLAGVCFAGALTEIGRDRPGGRTGAVMRAALPRVLSDDPATAIPALTEFVQGMGVTDGAEVQRMVGETLRVPPAVRYALFKRDSGSAEVLARMDVPVLVVHGTDDGVVDATSAEYTAGKIPGAKLRWFPKAGHVPFDERAEEFSGVLDEFARECHAMTG
ncbi:alpha/beta fold hydrolase [Labedaea rhizosphaerae]|uniref:Alpha-beta hydrolase superfamily lysophospholipase n=1 Tax=Labedaea rhizosphaerae TaxID=598644 RepID=A0A4V3D0G9_LABRH|nr:alpha/beta hydrolase [Labedaea rhizosphaerae]TDQ05575.1 alpha-beta hydrolase superfamily lysophospholipase [Labedaea rhizosphaerae]